MKKHDPLDRISLAMLVVLRLGLIIQIIEQILRAK